MFDKILDRKHLPGTRRVGFPGEQIVTVRVIPMSSLFHSLWQRLLQDLGLKPTDTRLFSLDELLLHSVQELASQEQRPEQEITADLLAYALTQHLSTETNLGRWQSLSAREQQVAALACLNYTNHQIAARLVIAPYTVKSHMRNILRKFDLHSKTELRNALADWDFSAWSDPSP